MAFVKYHQRVNRADLLTDFTINLNFINKKRSKPQKHTKRNSVLFTQLDTNFYTKR